MNHYDLLIIGGGPAALAAAVYAQAKQLRAAMIYEQFGGKTAWRQPRAPRPASSILPGNDVAGLLAAQINTERVAAVHDLVDALGVRDGIFAAETRHHGRLTGDAALVATGTTPRRLPLPGIQHLLDPGLGYSLTTFAHQVAGQRVAVVGATPRTIRGIAEIIDSAERIYLITAEDRLPGLPFLAALRQSPRLEVLTGATVRDVIGISAVKSMLVKRGAMIESLPVDQVFVDLGLTPNTQFLGDLPVTDPDGFVVVDEANATAIPGLYAAGDVTAAVFGEQVLIAVGDGVRAASGAYEYLLADRLAARFAQPALGERACGLAGRALS